MKPDDVYDGITEIRDDLIEKAKKPGRRRFWPAAVAAVLAVALVGGSLAALNAGRGDPASEQDGGGKTGGGIVTLAEARYPERPAYPVTDEFHVDEELYYAWWEEARSRWLTEEERAAQAGWKRTLVPALLSGAGEENAVCSPVSVYLALGMLTEVTDGSSREQVLSLLGADTVEELRGQANRVWNALYNDDGSYVLDLGASVWLRDDGQYETAPLETLAESWYASSYSGRMGSGEYNALLQKWLNDHTGGLLEDAVGNVELDDDTALALAATVLFKDKWGARFNPDATETGVFHAPSGDVEREFMRKNSTAEYYWGERFAAVSLAFESGGVMNLLLPDEGVDVEEILSDPAAMDWLTDAGDGEGVKSKYLKVDLSLPKFDVTQDGEIGGKLQNLGVTDVFDQGKADFSPILGKGASGGAWLSHVLHAARVMIDEEGCVGAAYTVEVGTGAVMPPDETVELVFDRPFLFTVMNEGVPVFAGVVNIP